MRGKKLRISSENKTGVEMIGLAGEKCYSFRRKNNRIKNENGRVKKIDPSYDIRNFETSKIPWRKMFRGHVMAIQVCLETLMAL